MEETTRTKTRTYVLIITAVVVALLGLLTVIYCIMASNRAGRFPEQTYINQIDVSGMTAGRAKHTLANSVEDYTLTIMERNGVTETITGEDIGLNYVDNGDVDALLAEYNPYRWFLDDRRIDELTAEADTVFDEEQAKAVVSNLSCFRLYTPAQDAEIELQGDRYVVAEEIQGNELKPAQAQLAILLALRSGVTEVNLEEQGLYVSPEVFADDEALNTRVEQLNSFLKADITFDFGDSRIVRVNARVIKDFVEDDAGGTPTLSLDKVAAFVRTKIAYRIDTFGLTHTFTTHNGTTIKLHGGDYGWCVDRSKTTRKLYDAILEGYVGPMEAVFQYSAKNMGVDDLGGTYVEVSIADQMMWCYKDYQVLVETPVVTGNVNRGNGTPYGSVWAIDAMKEDAVLGTLDTMGYESPVKYWMPFVGNVGIHDADGWRSNYGGKIYLSSGSHGCVNTPLEAAEKIFNTVQIGTAVVVYDLNDEETEIVGLPGEYEPAPDDQVWDSDD